MSGVLVLTDFGIVATSIVGIAIQCLIVGFVGGSLRSKLFSKEFMEAHFGEEHWKAFGEVIGKGGYPDTGSGRYSQHLNYKDWYEFNSRQRAHYNYLEQVAIIVSLVLVAGVAYPVAAGIIGWAYFVGRILYTIGYIKKGPSGRIAGVAIIDLALLAAIVVSIMSCVKVCQLPSA